MDLKEVNIILLHNLFSYAESINNKYRLVCLFTKKHFLNANHCVEKQIYIELFAPEAIVPKAIGNF